MRRAGTQLYRNNAARNNAPARAVAGHGLTRRIIPSSAPVKRPERDGGQPERIRRYLCWQHFLVAPKVACFPAIMAAAVTMRRDGRGGHDTPTFRNPRRKVWSQTATK